MQVRSIQSSEGITGYCYILKQVLILQQRKDYVHIQCIDILVIILNQILFYYRRNMGTCLASTPVQHYWTYFEDIKVSEIEDYWTTFEVFKIKKLYDQVSSQHPDFPKYTHIEEDKFIQMFPELQAFPEKQKQRFFQMFNYDGHGFVDWNNFFSMISICYFASEQTILVILFLIFDQSLSKNLTKPELQLMVGTTADCLAPQDDEEEEIPKFTTEQTVQKLLNGCQTLSLSKWQEKARQFYNVRKIRRIFNIFNEQKIEKELVSNFSEWNKLYIESQERYVSYLISYKWFESWKIYVKNQYGISLHSDDTKKPVTFKTRKLIKNKQQGTNKKIAENLKLRELKWEQQPEERSQKDYPEDVKNFDFVHSNIGQKPHQIYNNVLEGQYEQVLKDGLIENRDYVLISEKVWKSLKKVYGGMPEFRRTGYDFIELYPKILKVLKYSNGNIDYSDGTIKEVSGYYGIQDVLEAIFNKEYVQKHQFCFKCLGMKKWEKIQDLTYALAQITSEVMVFIIAVPEAEVQNFLKNKGKVAKDITDVTVGDFIKFENPLTKLQQTMVIMGKNIEGKYILHVPGQSYIYDICVLENELFMKGKLLELETVSLGNGKKLPPIDEIKMKRKQEIGFVGIPNSKGLGFINSTILQLYHDHQFRELLLLRGEKQSDQITVLGTLAAIFKDLSAKKKVTVGCILNMIEELFPDFQNFSANMCVQFINQFYKKIGQQLQDSQLKDITQRFMSNINRKTKCLKCDSIHEQIINSYCVTLPLSISEYKYYEIIYVPYNETLKIDEIKKYGFKLSANATFKNYKDTFEAIAGIMVDTKYLLMQVYANNIIKNYSTAKNEATLNQLMLRDTDTIVAYQLQTDFSDFIEKHYSKNVDYETRQIKIDQFVDCKNDNRGWIFGKVCQKDYTPYGHRTIIRVIHKFSKGEQWQISYDVDEETVAHFPTRSYLNGEQYHLRLQQRYFNEASNDMEICNIPLVVVLTNWMRWRQFYYMIYLQIKRFIINDIGEQLQHEEQDYNVFPSNKTISRKKTNKMKLNRFKDYLYGEEFPYKLNFVDYSGRCAICFKFLKSVVFPQEEDTYCAGCKLSKTEPLSWQIKVSDVMVCVDWKSLNCFKKDIIKDHSTLANMSIQRKNDVQDLTSSFMTMKNGYEDISEQICCATKVSVKYFQQVVSEPESLILHLDRVIEENGFIKTLNKHVKFEDEIDFNGKKYTLTGLTSIEGGSLQSTKYRTFISYDEDQWIEYDGRVVKHVKKNFLDRICALNLYYKIKEPKQ